MTSPAYPAWLNQQIQQGLQSGNQAAFVAAAKAAAEFQQQAPPVPLRRMFDAFYHEIGEVNNHIEISLQDPRQALPSGKMTLMGDDPLADVAVTCNTTVVPFVYDKVRDFDTWPPPYRWSGRVDVAHDKFNDGKRIVECELIGDKHWLDRILAWPDPFLPVWFQFPAQWFALGPGLTVLATLIMEQSFRIQSGLWEAINDLGSLELPFQLWLHDMQAASSLTLTDIMQVLHTPIAVVPINPLTDTSAWIEVNGRMDTVWKLIQQQLQDNGFDLTAQMWLPGDPQPPGLAFPLVNATVVIELKDRSGFTGPWGPFQGVLTDLVQLEGALLGNALTPILGGASQPFVNVDLGEFIAPNIGVDFENPWVILNTDVDDSGIIEYSIDFHHPLAFQVVTGGQSPKWVNDLINATLEWLIDSLMIVIGLTGLPNNILDGILDNVLFAFSLVDNYKTQFTSPYMLPEKFFPSGAGSLTLDTLFAEAAALWNVRGYPSGQVGFIDGYPYSVGRDIQRSQLIFYVRRGQLFIDYVENIQILDNRSQFNKVTLQIGDGRSEEAPMTKFQRKLVGMETVLNFILSGGNPQS